MPESITFGAHMIESLTTGMYTDAKIIFREYVQNSCDQIDKAVEQGILENREEGEIKIYISADKRIVSIEDNATGIAANLFRRTLADVANSEKKVGKDRGFRGIGRLAGLAYCSKLIFTSSAKGEKIKSIMTCDAERMREMIDDNGKGHRYTASDVLNSIYDFSTEKEEAGTHYFKVELVDVKVNNDELLDSETIKQYLSFVAPVPFINNFFLRKDIYKYAQENNHVIDEYIIKINGQQIFKNYEMKCPTRQGEDKFHGVEFKEFVDEKRNPLAWMWFACSDFKGALPDSCAMRGIRLRSANIQIGEENILQQFFKEERGAKYFVGEIYTLSAGLVPNSQRDYFNQTEERIALEKELKRYACDELNKIYHKGSEMNTLIKDLGAADRLEREFEQKEENNAFLDEQDREKEYKKMLASREKAEKSVRTIQALVDKECSDDNSVSKVVGQLAKSRLEEYKKQEKEETDKREEEKKTNQTKMQGERKLKKRHRTDNLTKLDGKQRKLIGRIYKAIQEKFSEDKELVEHIISTIEEEFK